MTVTYIVQFTEAGKVWTNETFERPDFAAAKQSAIDAINEAPSDWRVHRVLVIAPGRFAGQWVCIDGTEDIAAHFHAASVEDYEPVTPIVEALIQRFDAGWENPDPDAPRASSRNEHSTMNRSQQL